MPSFALTDLTVLSSRQWGVIEVLKVMEIGFNVCHRQVTLEAMGRIH